MGRSYRYDVVVVGGGAAGVAAAVGAARSGAKTMLVERYGFLGGAATNAQVLTYCGFFVQGANPRRAVGGVSIEVLESLKELGVDTTPVRSKSGYWIVLLDNEALKFALDKIVVASGAAPLMHARLIGANRDGDRLRSIVVSDHRGTFEVEASGFVDASGEGTLGSVAGVPSYFEAGDGVHGQVASYPFRIGGVAPDRFLSRPELTEIAAEINRDAADFKVRTDGGPFIRLPLSNELWWMAIDLETDGLSAPDLSQAELKGRRMAWACLAALRRRPGFEDAYIVATGPQLGTRESRRPQARAILTSADAKEGRRHASVIARAAWPMEVHEPPGRQVFVELGGEGFFDVPLDAIHAEGVDNLWLGGRIIGSDAQAYGSIRVMGTAFATGHAAGVAASLSCGRGMVEAAAAQEILRKQEAII